MLGGGEPHAAPPLESAAAETKAPHTATPTPTQPPCEVGSNSGTDDDKSRVVEIAGGGGGDDGENGDRSFGGNRWPKQETLALLQIRSDMDQAFRDSSLKGPLWDEVSRKLSELGYHRSAKKCKEKFENVYKYHKRTKEGRTGKSEGKHYKFFDQLEAFDHHHRPNPIPIPNQTHNQPMKPQTPIQTIQTPIPWPNNITTQPISHINISSNTWNTPSNPTQQPPPVVTTSTPNQIPNMNVSSNLFSSSTSSSTASDEQTEEDNNENENKKKRKWKWKEFFKRITKQVIEKQEELQEKFLESIEQKEKERVAREEAWRVQELSRLTREHEILIQERSTAAAKDAAVIAFLQKISGQHPIPSQPQSHPQTQSQSQSQTQAVINFERGLGPSSSRWPKPEIEALIRLRTELSMKYQENGPKGPLWEEISTAMKGLGYNRNAKRCKEKWENINKYFKKVKDSNKKRSENSKTCPYFNQLDALYKEKTKSENNNNNNYNYGHNNHVNSVPLMVQPEQQWPPPHQENVEDDDDDDDVGDSDDEEFEGGGFEIVANKSASIANNSDNNNNNNNTGE